MAESNFDPRWLYPAEYPARPAEYVDTQDLYDHLMNTGVWASSPAEFGHISAPNHEQTVLAAPQLPAAQPGEQMSAVEALAVHLAAKVEEVASEVEALHGVIQRMQREMETLAASVAEGKAASGRAATQERK
jgi:outer membrane murein-binding lipoprotein Lpp